MAATNQQPPRTPTRFTRASAAMSSPGAKTRTTRGLPPPRPRQNLPTRNNLKANPNTNAISSSSHLQGHLTTSASQTTETINTVPSSPRFTRTSVAMSSPSPNTVPSPPRFTRSSATMSSPGANRVPSPTRPTTNLSQQPTPTNSVNRIVPMDNSLGGQSSRQSNDINELAEQFDAANSEGHTTEG